jgi:hypothetical protein
MGAQVRLEAQEGRQEGQEEVRASEFTGRSEHTVVRYPVTQPHVLVQQEGGSTLVAPALYMLGDTVYTNPMPPTLPEGIQGPPGPVGPQGPKGDPALWVELTQAEYDALDPKDPNTLYVIVG